ncbi:hypothetical protein ACFQGW_06085 [Xanthomonas theicola]|uniref:hypothetical protein n=1 Tax=Xanthomonas theicola TaxID=56464 RepID=UPI003623452E
MAARAAAPGAQLLRGTQQRLPERLQGGLGDQAERLQHAGASARQHAAHAAADRRHAAQVDAARIGAGAALLGGLQHAGIADAARQFDRGLDGAGQAASFAADRTPALGPMYGAATAGVGSAALRFGSAMGMPDLVKTGAFAGAVLPSGSEAIQRHLNDTVLPSMDSRVVEREAAARQSISPRRKGLRPRTPPIRRSPDTPIVRCTGR